MTSHRDVILSTPEWTQEGANVHMACYAGYLAMGNTYHQMTVTAGTLRVYLKAAAEYIQRERAPYYTDVLRPPPLDPRHDYMLPWTGKVKNCQRIEQILKEITRWQRVKNRRQPLTTNMINDLIARSAALPLTHRERAIADWCSIGIYLGLRCCEYLQAEGVTHRSKIKIDHRDQLPQAFLSRDVRFFGRGGRALSHAQAIADPSLAMTVQYQWRFQKNERNGETKSCVRHPRNSTRCPVLASIRIIQRHRILNPTDDLPLAVFSKDATATPSMCALLHAGHLNTTLKACACRLYGFSPDSDEASKYTSHAVRVGACVALFANGAKEMQIQFALRWASKTYRDYLRDIPLAAAATNRLVDLQDAFEAEATSDAPFTFPAYLDDADDTTTVATTSS